MFIKKSVKVFVLVVLVLALSGFTYAFAAANTVDPSRAGDGSGVISGYDVSAIHYTLNAADPSTIDAVEFSLDFPATDVYAKIDTSWSSACIFTTVWTCAFTTQPDVAPALTLQVVAAD